MQIIGVGDLIKKSWDLYWSNLKLLLTISVWMVIPLLAAVLLAFVPANLVAVIVPLSLIVFAATFIVNIWVTICLVQVSAKLYQKQKVNLRIVFQGAWSKMIPLIWVSFLTGLAVLGGMILFIIPGIIIAVWFAFSTFLNILDNVRGTAALKQSKAMVSGLWWSTAIRFVVPYIVFGILFYGAAWIILMAITPLTNYFAGTNQDIIVMIESIITSALNIFTTPMFIMVGAILYLEIKKIKGLRAVS